MVLRAVGLHAVPNSPEYEPCGPKNGVARAAVQQMHENQWRLLPALETTEKHDMTDIYKKLAAPFPPDVVSWRVGSMNKDKTKGMALAYIDARDVMSRLDEIVGPANWQASYPHANGKTICAIGIKCDGEWVWKANGAGDTDIEAEKGAISDAFKRAAVLWGIGRYLYDLPSPWVAVNQYKQIEESEFPRLRKLLSNSAPPSPARNAGGSPASSPNRQDEPPAALSDVAPKGVNEDLWATAVARAQGGVTAYRQFWENDATKAERQALLPHHGQLKSIAANATKEAA